MDSSWKADASGRSKPERRSRKGQAERLLEPGGNPRPEPSLAGANGTFPRVGKPTLLHHFQSLGALFLSAFLLFLGQGIFLAAVPLRLGQAGESPSTISLVASVYFVGILCGSWLSGPIVRRVGHIRAFAGFVAMVISAALLLALASAGSRPRLHRRGAQDR